MSEGQDVREMRRIVSLLEKTHRLAREASMTGALSGGMRYAVQQYNAIVSNLAERGILLSGYFPPLSEENSFDDVGIAAAQLAEFLKADLPQEDEAPRHGRHAGHGSISVNIGDLPDLKNIGEVIRESLPEWMRAARGERRAERRSERESEGSGEATANPGAGGAAAESAAGAGAGFSGLRTPPPGGSSAETPLTELESRLAEIGAKIQVVAEQMRREDLPPSELQRLAGELSRLGQEQAQIAQEAAAKRTLGGS